MDRGRLTGVAAETIGEQALAGIGRALGDERQPPPLQDRRQTSQRGSRMGTTSTVLRS